MTVRAEGMVLLTTLMMITLVAEMVMSAMRAVLLLEKVNQRLALTHQAFYEFDAVLEGILEQASTHTLSACINTPCQWLQGTHTYSYEVVDWGIFPCLRLLIHEQTVASHHWQLTVHSMYPTALTRVVRIATRGPLRSCTSSIFARISKGVLSWHDIA